MKDNYKFVFVILHYLTVADTERCINSILKLRGSKEDAAIVVVDNHSPNGSGQTLKKRYSNSQQVKIILAQQNLGFARGNNLGFHYAKYRLNADFIIMVNSDTYIAQSNFLKKVDEEYQNSKFAVLGPKIILKNGDTNGVTYTLKPIACYKKDLRIMKCEYLLNLTHLHSFYVGAKRSLSAFLRYIGIKKERDKAKNDPEKKYENIILHGCALVFSEEYIKRFDGLDDRTFLYREEELLYLRLRRAGLKNIYSPSIEIHHDEDGPTDASTGGGRGKQLFIAKNLIQSTKLLIDELKKEDSKL